MPPSTSKPTSTPPLIPHPLHLLILSPIPTAQSTLPPFLTALTSATPPDSISSFTGYTTHPPLRLSTRYYVADVGVWCDEIPVAASPATSDNTPTLTPDEGKEDESPENAEEGDLTAQWARVFQSEEAKQVLTAIGAVILVLPSSRHTNALSPSTSTSVLKAAKSFRQTAEEERTGGDVVGVCCVVSSSCSAEEQGDEEERIMETLGLGWEVVFWDGKADIEKDRGRMNEFGERQSITRIHEILSTNEWAADDASVDLDFDENQEIIDDTSVDLDFDEDQEVVNDTGFSLEAKELERELSGLWSSILSRGKEWADEDAEDTEANDKGGDGEQGLKVDELAGLMERIRGIRDLGKDMPEDERKRYAARAVNDIMKTL